MCYTNGEGIKEDKAEAMKWFRKAVEQGKADAIAYLNGKGVKKDNAEAKVTGKPKWGILSRIIKSIVVVVLRSICVAIGIVHDYYQNTEQKRNAVAAAEQLLIAPNEISRIKIARLPVKLISETVNGNTNTHPVLLEGRLPSRERKHTFFPPSCLRGEKLRVNSRFSKAAASRRTP